MLYLIYVYNLIAKSNIGFLAPSDHLTPHASELQRLDLCQQWPGQTNLLFLLPMQATLVSLDLLNQATPIAVSLEGGGLLLYNIKCMSRFRQAEELR